MILVHFWYKLSFHYPCVLRLKSFIFKLMEHQIWHAWKINERRKMWFKWWVFNIGKDMELSKLSETTTFTMIEECYHYVLWFCIVHHLLRTMGFGCDSMPPFNIFHPTIQNLEEIMNKNGGTICLFRHFPFIHYVEVEN